MLRPRGSGFTGSQNAARLVPGASQPGCVGAGRKPGGDALGEAGSGDAGLAGGPLRARPGTGGIWGAGLGGIWGAGVGGGPEGARFAQRGGLVPSPGAGL